MTPKETKISDSLKELSRAISDVKKKYGDAVDSDFLQDKIQELIKNLRKWIAK